MILRIIFLYGYVSVRFGEVEASDVPEYCGEGPSAWCQNFTTSVDCHATKYCQAAWLTDKPTGRDSCGGCEMRIRKIRRTLDSGSRFDVNELTRSICESSESQFLRLECQNSLNQFARHHEWLHFLASDVHPTTVCHVIGVCSEIKSTGPGVVTAENIHFPVKSAKSTVFEGCSSNLCTNLTSSRKCKSTSLCIGRVWSKQLYPEDDDSVCLVCQNMVQRARNQIQQNATSEELRRQLRASCELISVKKALRECLRVADNFLAEFAEMLASQMNPTAVCTVASLCNNAHTALLKAKPASIRTINPKHDDPAATRDSLCYFCQYLLHFIQEELEKPEEQQRIERAMNRTCELVAKSVRAECQSFFFEYGPLIISLFSHEIDPSLVCPALNICPQNASRTVPFDV